MKHLEIDLPDEVVARMGDDAEVQTRVREAVTLDLVRRGEISTSYASEILGVSYDELLKTLARRKIPLLDYDPRDLDAELERLR